MSSNRVHCVYINDPRGPGIPANKSSELCIMNSRITTIRVCTYYTTKLLSR